MISFYIHQKIGFLSEERTTACRKNYFFNFISSFTHQTLKDGCDFLFLGDHSLPVLYFHPKILHSQKSECASPQTGKALLPTEMHNFLALRPPSAQCGRFNNANNDYIRNANKVSLNIKLCGWIDCSHFPIHISGKFPNRSFDYFTIWTPREKKEWQ